MVKMGPIANFTYTRRFDLLVRAETGRKLAQTAGIFRCSLSYLGQAGGVNTWAQENRKRNAAPYDFAIFYRNSTRANN
jgi:hypothetical protein